MQAAKDSFYIALRERLAQVNPARTLPGSDAPAVAVCENLQAALPFEPETFYLRWLGEASLTAETVAAGWRGLRCEIAYRTSGTYLACGEDRGRVLSELDGELRAMLVPRSTVLRDYSATPEADLGGTLLWTLPRFADAKLDPRGLERTVELELAWRDSAAGKPGGETESRPVTTSLRMFAAPVDREAGTGTMFDPSTACAFDIENPPSPWLAVGEVENLQRAANDELAPVAAGAESAVIAQLRRKLEARVSFELRRWGKLQLAVATGGTHWNVLAADAGAPPSPVGGNAIPACRLLAGSDAQRLQLGPGEGSAFAAGDFVAVDRDFQQQGGYFGLGNAEGFVSAESETLPGVDYVRRVSCNVGRVAEVNGDLLILDHRLPAGDPPLTAGVQKVVAFADREGGAFRQQWSALFVEQTVIGGKVFYYYPRLQSIPPAMERSAPIAGDYKALLLQARMLALPSVDPQDGASALWYRVYVPPAPAGS